MEVFIVEVYDRKRISTLVKYVAIVMVYPDYYKLGSVVIYFMQRAKRLVPHD